MIKEICKDQFILSQVSNDATIDDLSVANDLLDTLKYNESRCVGMAANMIGVLKNIIAINDNGKYLVMINPKIIDKSKTTYKTMEGCLSHIGEKETKRYYFVKVEYLDMKFKKTIKKFDGFTAQIIQHEIDHLNGVLI